MSTMWEMIAKNQQKTFLLILFMGSILGALCYSIGRFWLGPEGGKIGMLSALAVWLLWTAFSYYTGETLILSSSMAKTASPDEYQQLINIVEEVCVAANYSLMPKIYVIPSQTANAFATGRDPDHASIAVTRGLLELLNREELQGVVAHEISHILNRDTLLLTVAGVMIGFIEIITHAFWHSLTEHSVRDSDATSNEGCIFGLLALLLSILSPLIVTILYFAISRKRETLADVSAARLTRNPEGLASALEKISRHTTGFLPANRVTAPMYIAKPQATDIDESGSFFDTHPPIQNRIRLLRHMAGTN